MTDSPPASIPPVRRLAGRWAAVTHRVLGRVPRWGSVAQPGTRRAGWSTTPGGGAGRGRAARGGAGGGRAARGGAGGGRAAAVGAVGVVGCAVVFLLARPVVGLAVPVLAVGYLVMLGGALLVPEVGGRGVAPLGWGVPLVVGIGAVVAAGVVGGPVGDRRVGAVAAGLGVLAAVAEEAVFRRVLYDRLLRFGVVAAVTGCGLVFALVHLPSYGLVAMPVDLGAALLLSWQRYASGRWTVPAVTHAVANLLAVT
jgi:membrane protease YdiL (CAAX protease family)